MSWKTLSLHFRQQYDGAFRYLDRCGEFIVDAVDQFGFLPGDAKPTGAKLEIPEQGLTAAVDSGELITTQEMPEDDGRYFLEKCEALSGLVEELFRPKGVIRNGFACKSFCPFTDADALLKASLQFGGNAHLDLGKLLDMVPAHKKLDFNFSSGSKDLHVLLHPVTFEKVSSSRHNPNFKASPSQREKIERRNKFAERFNVPLSHALMLEIDLMEIDPPQRSLDEHFGEMVRHTDVLRKHFIVK